jgi:VanZ family protein
MATKTILLALGAVSVLFGCLAPKRWLPILPHDKLLHFLAFCGLSIVAGSMAGDTTELIVWLLALFVAGCLIEILQHWIPGRSFCWRDIAANTAGIAAAGIVDTFVRL